jgi:hypothetical protein
MELAFILFALSPVAQRFFYHYTKVSSMSNTLLDTFSNLTYPEGGKHKSEIDYG